jgi:DNA-binding transcriptional MerR regulator
MNDFPLDEPRYTRILAARLANISLEFLDRCETERLIDVRIISGDQPGYSARDIRHLTLIRRLHEDLEIDFPALEVVLNMRRQLLDLQTQMDAFERQAAEREERLKRELANLRKRLADEADWV